MTRLAALAVLAALALAGCGGTTKHAAPAAPRLPRALAQAWAQQADGVAAALAAGDGCTALQVAGTLRAEVVQALNQRLIPHAFQETIVGAVNDLPARITCTPAKHSNHEHKPKHDHRGDGGGG